MLSFIFHFAFSINTQQIISDPNIVLNQNGTFSIIANKGRYELSKGDRYVEYKNTGQKLYFQGSKTDGRLFVIDQLGSQTTVDRYRYRAGGSIDGLTKCEIDTSNAAGENEDLLLCQYMDFESCRALQPTAKRLSGDVSRCQAVIQELTAALPSEARYAARAETAIQDVSDAFSNLGLDRFEFARVFKSDRYRLRSRQDVKAKQAASALDLFQTFRLAKLICSTIETPANTGSSTTNRATR